MYSRHAAIAFAVFTISSAASHAQTPLKAETSSETALPVRRVVLFSSGVGFFERQGEVDGAASMPLSFRIGQINDVLKSLVVFDGDGSVRPVTFATKDSLQRQLSQGNISLDAGQSLGQLLRQFRGARVRIETGGKTLEGQILSVQTRVETDDKNRTVTTEILNLLTETGLRAVPLDSIGDIKLLDETLNRRLLESLALTATGLDDSKRTVQLNFDGKGRRSVRAAYLLEAPVWKTSYRLVLDDKAAGKPYLQGWGQIENQTDDDWTNVSLSLVSGRPISFIQDLYQPLYVSRPVVAPQVIGSPNPQLYGEAVDEEKSLSVQDQATASESRADAPASALARRGAVGGRGRTNLQNAPGGFGGGGGGGGFGGEAAASADFARGVNSDDLAKTAAQAQGGVRGELFEYAIKTPVSLAKNQAAMVPIVSENIGGEAVSIFNPAASTYALRGFRLRNDTKLHLAGGPLTVFQGGTYAGDAQIGDVGPGEDRLISYAVDLEIVPAVNEPTFRADLLSLSAKSGILTVTRKQVRTLSYAFRNKAAATRKLLVQLPIEADFKLIEPTTGVEKTATEYRIAVAAAAGKTTNLKVVTERPISEAIALTNLDFDVLVDYARNAQASPALKAALQGLVAQRRKIAELQTARANREKELADIATEQDRIRKNMEQLDRNSALYKQYVAKLTAQEERVETLRTQIEKLRTDEVTAQKELNQTIDGLTI